MSDDKYADDGMTSMPFVLTKFHGGEYDNEAYAAGWYLGVLDARLTLAEVAGLGIPPVLMREKWKAQVDLIAMARGLVMTVTPVDAPEGYAIFSFSDGDSFHAEDEL